MKPRCGSDAKLQKMQPNFEEVPTAKKEYDIFKETASDLWKITKNATGRRTKMGFKLSKEAPTNGRPMEQLHSSS